MEAATVYMYVCTCNNTLCVVDIYLVRLQFIQKSQEKLL